MALYDQYVSVKMVIAKVYRDLQLEEEDKIGDMIEWAAEALDFIGAYNQYKSSHTKLCVECFSTTLPSDFLMLEMISYNGRPLQKSTDVFGPNHKIQNTIETSSYIVNEASLYNVNFVGNVGSPGQLQKASYSIDGRSIRTSFEEGEIVIQYMARVLDEDNWPMIPDTAEFKEAVFRYIVYKMSFAEFMRGKISPAVYEKLEQDWWRRCKQARGEAYMPDLNTMQNLATSYLSLKPNLEQYKTFFTNLGTTQNRRY